MRKIGWILKLPRDDPFSCHNTSLVLGISLWCSHMISPSTPYNSHCVASSIPSPILPVFPLHPVYWFYIIASQEFWSVYHKFVSSNEYFIQHQSQASSILHSMEPDETKSLPILICLSQDKNFWNLTILMKHISHIFGSKIRWEICEKELNVVCPSSSRGPDYLLPAISF